MKKLLISFLLLLLVLSVPAVLTSCDEEPSTPANTDGESITDTDGDTEPGASFVFFEDGIPKFTLVRAESMSAEAINNVVEFRTKLNSLGKQEVEISTDFSLEYLQTGTHDPDAYEIVVGKSNYEEAAELYEQTAMGEYVIKMIGKKIFVYSIADEGIAHALNSLWVSISGSYDESSNGASLSVLEIDKTKNYDTAMQLVPVVDGLECDSVYDCGDGSSMMIYKKATEEIFDGYVDKVKESGYKLHSSREMEKNKFVTYYCDELILNAMYLPTTKEIRVIADDNSKYDLPMIDKEYDESKKVCESILIQVGTSPADNESQNGQCYLIRCEDGGFIVYDGGWEGNQSGATPRNNIARLYNTLKEYTPKGIKPRINAWVLTHAHGDHTGLFAKFVQTYRSTVDVKQFVINFPSDNDTVSVENDGASRYKKILNAISTYYKSSDVVKIHTGNYFKYANMEMECLYTIELFLPKQDSYFNTTSTVTRLFVEDQSILMAGDMSADANEIIRRHFKDYIKSDFYQVTHHGSLGGSDEFNRLCDPQWALWPCGDTLFEVHKSKNTTRVRFLLESPTVKKNFVAGFRTTVINLPFDGKEGSYEVYPNA